ncbi:MAG: hypothetical protein KDB27_11270, partial [Planctomycetales bacterium]|nr:hypothetical protein [Planctomycetales bacterium]
MKSCRIGLLLMTVLISTGSAETLWQDDFNADSSDAYEILLFNEDRDRVVFAFDYSQIGIPEAPNSPSGGTTGVQMFANDPFEDTLPATSAVQVVPSGLDSALAAATEYTMTFDIWMNMNGPMPAGGAGSSEAMMAGVGFSANAAIEAGNIDGTYFTLLGDAGASTADVRSFTDDGYNANNFDSDTPINVGGAVMNGNPYFADAFPGGIVVDDLPIQGGSDSQTGTTIQGQMAFEWHEVRLDVRGREVSFYVNDLLIARDEDAAIEGNAFFGYADYFSSVTGDPQWGFGLVDNLHIFTPANGDFNGDGDLTVADINLLTAEVIADTNDGDFDLNGDDLVNSSDRVVWIKDLFNTYFGDANLDGEFNSTDFVVVFTANLYEDDVDGNATWETGDWNGDGD